MNNTLLIADDSKLVVSLVRNIFEGGTEQFKVIVASNGKEAIEKTISELPDIILMDWQMPELTGLEALVEIKKNAATSHIPVIMLTASESTTQSYELGASDFVQKPFNKTELISRVKIALEAVNARKELKARNVEFEIQREKLKIQKEQLIKQKKEISENDEFAVLTQQFLMPHNYLNNSIICESFLLEMPIAEMPMHFLWVQQKNDLLFICAGFHALTAISSLLLTSCIYQQLNTIVLDNSDTGIQPNKILGALQKAIAPILNSKNDLKHCTDLVLCILNKKTKSLQYAGVNVPVFIFKNEKMVELKTDKVPSGFALSLNEYLNHKVQLAEGDLLYILNDGFNESKSGIMEETYISDEILALFKKIYSKELPKQKQLLEKAFDNWRKDLKQVNDILVFGLKV